MNNELMIFEGQNLEVLTKENVNFEFNGEVLFNGKQVCSILEYSNDRDALSKHVRENQKFKVKNSDVAKHDFRQLNNAGETFITEKGVMKLIISSKMPKAEEFEDRVWDIVSEVQKTGRYDIVEQKLMQIQDPKEKELSLAVYRAEQIVF
jgi:prophage antirepressor-like protein